METVKYKFDVIEYIIILKIYIVHELADNINFKLLKIVKVMYTWIIRNTYVKISWIIKTNNLFINRENNEVSSRNKNLFHNF